MSPIAAIASLPAPADDARIREDVIDPGSSEPARILVVDDNEVNRRLLKGVLSRQGYSVDTAPEAETAIAIAKTECPDLILLDIMMPGKDGYQACKELKEIDRVKHVPIILLSALSDSQDKVKGLDLGAADYITKPFDRFEVLARVRSQIKIRRLTRRLIDQNGELERKQSALESDLQAAASIQRALLPTKHPRLRNASCSWRFIPSDRVSGDIFNVYPFESGQIGIHMTDVSGHGVPAAMVTVCLSQSLSLRSGTLTDETSGAVQPANPAMVLERLDREYPLERFGKHLTIAYLLLDPDTGRLTYSKAGHPPPIVVRRSGEIELLTTGGPVIGLGIPIPFDEATTKLLAGDRVFLHTDGIVELENASGVPYGEPRLYDSLRGTMKSPLDEVCDQVIGRLSEFADGVPPEDDISLLAIEYSGGSTEHNVEQAHRPRRV